MVNSSEVSAAIATRARIVLWRAEGRQKQEVAALAGVSRPTLYQLQNDQNTGEAGVALAMLSALGGLGPQTAEQLSSVTKIAEALIVKAIEDLVARQLVSVALGYYTVRSRLDRANPCPVRPRHTEASAAWNKARA